MYQAHSLCQKQPASIQQSNKQFLKHFNFVGTNSLNALTQMSHISCNPLTTNMIYISVSDFGPRETYEIYMDIISCRNKWKGIAGFLANKACENSKDKDFFCTREDINRKFTKNIINQLQKWSKLYTIKNKIGSKGTNTKGK